MMNRNFFSLSYFATKLLSFHSNTTISFFHSSFLFFSTPYRPLLQSQSLTAITDSLPFLSSFLVLICFDYRIAALLVQIVSFAFLYFVFLSSSLFLRLPLFHLLPAFSLSSLFVFFTQKSIYTGLVSSKIDRSPQPDCRHKIEGRD